MKVLLVNTTDVIGGAARGAYRLHVGLRQLGVESEMLVRYKASDDAFVYSIAEHGSAKLRLAAATAIDRVPLQLYPRREHVPWSLQWFPTGAAGEVERRKPDILHLNWIGGLLPISGIDSRTPLFWTLSDMWPFTGGCHYDDDCGRFRNGCGQCPQLHSNRQRDISHWILHKKKRQWHNTAMVVVAISRWLGEAARSSSLFAAKRVEVIPYGLDTDVYHPVPKVVARDLLQLSHNRKLILFGADGGTKNPRKGGPQLREAVQKLRGQFLADEIELVIFGESQPADSAEWGFPVHYLGRLYDDVTLAVMYSAADVTVVPSIQEAFGQTASESLACATPVVAFDGTGLRDIVDHQVNGYRARPFDPEDLARGIAWVIEDENRWKDLSANARRKAESEYTLGLQARRYRALYEEELERRQGR